MEKSTGARESSIEGGEKENKNENPHINWENLKSTNPEIVGWIKVPGTKIDYPILQGKEWNE